MHPVSLIGSTKTGERGFTFFVNRELTSVLAPGIFIVAELSYLTLRFSSTSSAHNALAYLKNLGGTVGFLLLLIASAAGYVVGYVVRELAFRFLGVLEKIPAIKNELTTDTGERLEQYFGGRLIAECLEAHPFLHRKLQPNDPAEDINHYRMAGGANVETRYYESFVYAKLWIRNFSPGFSVDSIEIEINVLAAALAPSMLLAVDILASVRLTWWTVLLTAVFLAVVWWVLLNSLFRLRRTERWEAVRNLIIDYTMRSAAENYPLSSSTDEVSG
jgi:cbb3-type cytochrome oxidase subunit 3